MHVSIYIVFVGMVCNSNDDAERGVCMEDGIIDEAPVHALDDAVEQIGKDRARWDETSH
jgi:hypothetical protein